MKENSEHSELASQGWKGVGPASETPLQFSRKKHSDESDMTSMVDVTFLLLIFFMVTASFSLQKAMATPPSLSDKASIHTPLKGDQRVVTIEIDQFNTFTVTCEGHPAVEAASDQELRAQLSDLGMQFQDRRVVIEANAEAWHEKVVTAWDAALAAGFTKIGVSMVE